MALRSVYTIDVDGSQFEKFRGLFDKYQEALKKLPAEWKSVNEAMAGAAVAATGLEKHSWGAAVALSKQVEESKKLGVASRATAATWSGISGSFMKVNEYITKATSNLLKWSTFTTALSGLLGAGALFGIDRLANSINAQRRSAKGLGVSYGQQAAINSNYSQIINPGSLLSNVAEAKYDEPGDKFTALMNLGLSRKQLESENAAQIVMDLLAPGGALETKFKNVPQGVWGTVAHQIGTDQLISVPDLIQFLNSSPEAKKKLAEQTAKDASRMDLSDQAQDKWANLVNQLARAGKDIEATFGEKFARFAPQLESLSKLFVSAADKIANSPLIDEWVKDLEGGLHNLAVYISKDDFTHGVENFVKWIGDAAKSIWDFVSGFSGAKPPLPNSDTQTPPFMDQGGTGYPGPPSGASRSGGGSSGAFPSPGRSPLLGSAPGGGGNSLTRAMGGVPAASVAIGSGSSAGSLTDAITQSALDAAGGDVNRATEIRQAMEGIRSGESYRNSKYDHYQTSREDSWGPFQLNRLHPGDLGYVFEHETEAERKRLGLGDLSDPRTQGMQAQWVARYIAAHPDLAPWGGVNWPTHHPREADPRWGNSGYVPFASVDHEPDTRREAIDSWRSAGKLPTIYLHPQTGANVARSAAMVTSPFTTVSP